MVFQLKKENVPVVNFDNGSAFTLPIPKRFLDDDIQLRYPSDPHLGTDFDHYYSTLRRKTGFVSSITVGGAGCHCMGNPSEDFLSPPWIYIKPEEMKIFSTNGKVEEMTLNMGKVEKEGREWAVEGLGQYLRSDSSVDRKNIVLGQTVGYRYNLHNVDNQYYAERLRDLGMKFVNDGIRQLAEKGLIKE